MCVSNHPSSILECDKQLPGRGTKVRFNLCLRFIGAAGLYYKCEDSCVVWRGRGVAKEPKQNVKLTSPPPFFCLQSIEIWDVSGNSAFESGWPAVSQHADGVLLVYNPEKVCTRLFPSPPHFSCDEFPARLPLARFVCGGWLSGGQRHRGRGLV